MDAIVKILTEAGYFRARISSLSDFDKIIGAIAWALQFLSYDININIFYVDSLDLGQKIALTERLVMVLIAMKCPYPIEPHQIVGLDYVNLLPVIDWIVKRSAVARREHAAFNRLLALRHFHRVTNTLPDRSEWCQLLSPARYKQLQASVGSSDLADEGGAQESKIVDRFQKESFKTTQQHVSFVQLPSLHPSVTNRWKEPSGNTLERRLTESEDSDDDELLAPRRGIADCHRAEANNEQFPEEKENSNSQHDVELHKELDTELVATNQKILNLIKKLDSIPSKLEVDQYQSRYIELHQQLISKNKDLKKVYALYNSLESSKHYLTKELNLLDSILSNLGRANSSARNRELFLSQFRQIVLQIGSVRDGVSSRLEVMRHKRNKLLEEYNAIVFSNKLEPQ